MNYGHTIGHSLEGLTNYGKLLHGEAVSIGMVVAARISENLNLSTTDMTNKIIITLLLIELALHLAEIAFDLHAHYGLQELLYG